jgi:hypothetical protein
MKLRHGRKGKREANGEDRCQREVAGKTSGRVRDRVSVFRFQERELKSRGP